MCWCGCSMAPAGNTLLKCCSSPATPSISYTKIEYGSLKHSSCINRQIQCRKNGDELPVLNNTQTSKKQSCPVLENSSVLAKAASYVRKDALLMTTAAQNLDEKARKDLVVLARQLSMMDVRARQDVAIIGSEFLKLDARARQDAEKLDMKARAKVQRIKRIAMGIGEIATTEIRMAVNEHWNDGGLEADLRLTDLRARRRAWEDSYATVQAVKRIHIALLNVMQAREKLVSTDEIARLSPSEASVLRLANFEDDYQNLSSLLVENDVLDYGNSDELEFILAALLDMGEVDGSGASLVTQCSNSPDDETRQALADALAGAPSLWALGNAGISALQRLAKDANPAVAAAASKALDELQCQWEECKKEMFIFDRYESNDPTEDHDDNNNRAV